MSSTTPAARPLPIWGYLLAFLASAAFLFFAITHAVILKRGWSGFWATIAQHAPNP